MLVPCGDETGGGDTVMLAVPVLVEVDKGVLLLSLEESDSLCETAGAGVLCVRLSLGT